MVPRGRRAWHRKPPHQEIASELASLDGTSDENKGATQGRVRELLCQFARLPRKFREFRT